MIKMTTWSISRLKDYTTCPAKAKYKHIDRLQDVGSAAMSRGTSVHKMAEDYSQAKGRAAMPPELMQFAEEFQVLRARADLMAEKQWALTAEWKPTPWGAPDSWVRLVVDCAYADKHHGRVIDYKTGKRYDDHDLQLNLYALAMFCIMPNVKTISAEMWYLDQGLLYPTEFQRYNVPTMKKEWATRVAPMMNDTTFVPTPGKACARCAFSRKAGGPCQY